MSVFPPVPAAIASARPRLETWGDWPKRTRSPMTRAYAFRTKSGHWRSFVKMQGRRAIGMRLSPPRGNCATASPILRPATKSGRCPPELKGVMTKRTNSPTRDGFAFPRKPGHWSSVVATPWRRPSGTRPMPPPLNFATASPTIRKAMKSGPGPRRTSAALRRRTPWRGRAPCVSRPANGRRACC